jgi:hypothetical protein
VPPVPQTVQPQPAQPGIAPPLPPPAPAPVTPGPIVPDPNAGFAQPIVQQPGPAGEIAAGVPGASAAGFDPRFGGAAQTGFGQPIPPVVPPVAAPPVPTFPAPGQVVNPRLAAIQGRRRPEDELGQLV